jgi:hypothetical protein
VPGWPEQDPRLIAYVFEHAYRWLGGDPAHAELWSPPIFFPQRDVGQYTEPLFGLAPFSWPWRLAGLAPLAAYQLWLATVFALNYLSALALLRWSLGTALAPATLGSFVFAFGSARFANLSKAHLVPSFYLVLATIALVELFRDPPRSPARSAGWLWVAVFAAALVAQFNSAFYPFWFYGLALLVAAAWTSCEPSLRRGRRACRRCGARRGRWCAATPCPSSSAAGSPRSRSRRSRRATSPRRATSASAPTTRPRSRSGSAGC